MNIVICCDGTWNTPDQKEGGVPAPTNVVRLFNAIDETDGVGKRQHKYYHPGVGTDGSIADKLIGGGTGRGLDRNIMSAYRELCDRYAQGDRIYLFGFSRGAYTVRSLAGLISRCGLLNTVGLKEAEAWQRIERVFQLGYRRKTEDRSVWAKESLLFHNAPDQQVPIRFIGVWDTVGALGIPDDLAFLNLIDNVHDYTFHDTTLGGAVMTARHAVALDEMRATFQPTLWTETGGRDVKQIWFPGVHCDVGGGYREAGLPDAALKWMIDEAAACDAPGGLVFRSAMVDQIKPNELDMMHDSCDGPFSFLPTQPRSAPHFATGGAPIHKSAIVRQKNPPIHQCPYRQLRRFDRNTPLTIDVYALQQWNPTGLWLERDKTYEFSASGEWMDSSIKCGPGGTNDGHFQAGELVQMAGSALGKIEDWFKKFTGNNAADFRFTKRHESMPWFCLVGTIANGGGVDAKNHLEAHESFKIGAGCRYTPRKSGYLYAYANDAWNCYDNNRGSVQLTITGP